MPVYYDEMRNSNHAGFSQKSARHRNKLLVGLMRATIKRDIDTKKLNEIIDDIEVELRSRTLTAVTSHELGDMVLKRLAKIDKVAYIRFASVYRDFKDVDEFLQELDKLR